MDKYYDHFLFYTNRLQMDHVLGDVYVDFSSADTAEKKFLYTLALLKKHSMLPTFVANGKYGGRGLAETIRCQGNEYFRVKKYVWAMDTYTRSLIATEPDTECYALALGNRSAAFFYLKLYDCCLKDLHRALASKYPARLVYKLYERAGNAERLLGRGDLAKENYSKCLKHLKRASLSDEEKCVMTTEIINSIKKCEGLSERKSCQEQNPVDELLGGKNHNIPALSKFLELKCSKNMGRGVYATRDINPGDVVAIDEPYICGPTPNVMLICHYNDCLKMSLAVIPCTKCSLVVYCDEECMQKASENGHHLECSIMYSIRTIPGIPRVNELVMKWFLSDFSKMGLEKYCSVVNTFYKTKINEETRGFDENGQYKSSNFLTAYSLEISENKISMDVLFFFNCIAVEMLQYLTLSGFTLPEHYLATVGVSFVHMLKVLDFNCWRLNLIVPPSIPNPIDSEFPTTLALYPSICLFNHSCDANVTRSGLYCDRTRVLKAIQPIPKGNQLFISYGVNFTTHNKLSREICCMDQFKFKCYCQPCIENWPTRRYIPNRLSSLNLLNPCMADTVSSECLKFVEFLRTGDPNDPRSHLNYLYSVVKLLFTNIKRPFAMYEDCLVLIASAHLSVHGFFSELTEHI